MADGRWVSTWVSMPQLAAVDGQDGLVMSGATLRQTIHTSIGGRRIRLRLSNAFGGTALPVTAVSVALPAGGRAGVPAIRPGTSRPVTFHGQSSVDIPAGTQVVSDPLDFVLPPRCNLTVTMCLAGGRAPDGITGHPGSRTTSYLLAGNHAEAEDLPAATPTDQWYFLTAVDVWASGTTAAAVMLGDSLTDGRGSTTNMNNRWPDRLFARLHIDPGTTDVAVLIQAAGGNRVLTGGSGDSALSRLDRDVLAHRGVRWLVVFEGVNDIGTAGASEAAQKRVADDLVAAYDQIIVRSHAQGIRVYGATLLPFGGNAAYDDGDGVREGARQRVNEWIRTGGRFDGVIDFDLAARDPDDPRRLLAAYDEGDHLHLNPAGYQALADAVPAELFR